MGSDVCQVQETTLHPSCVKVHFHMCIQLLRLVDRISHIFQEIEAARPRCSSGVNALCMLLNAMEEGRKHVHNCCESSKLYLALTGNTVVSRFERTRCLLQKSLSELQNMVPVDLRFKISEILDDLKDTEFFMDSHEEEAGKALRALLQGDVTHSVGTSEIEVLQFAALRLHLSSHKDFLIERRSIRKLLYKMEEGKSKKGGTLKYLLSLLKKYDQQIVQGQTRIFPTKNDKRYFNDSANLEFHRVYAKDIGRTGILQSSIPPEEFICPISSRLMYDPVIISSGQTFDRTSIEKWFKEGHDTCPTTKLKLAGLSVTPNTSMRDLISKWSNEHGGFVSNPRIQSSSFRSLETSDSISSTASSMKDLHLRIDISNISLGSLDSSYNSDISHTKVEKAFSSLRGPSDVESHTFQIFNGIHDVERQFLSDISGLPWELQCRAVEDVKYYVIRIDPSCSLLSCENFLVPLVQFLKDGLDKNDADAQKTATQLLLTFLKTSRREAVPAGEDLYTLLASNLGKEVTAEMLAIMEVLSAQENAFSKFAASGALTSVIIYLGGGHNNEFEEAAIRVLYNLSLSIDTYSCKLALDWIPKLVPFLRESSVAGTCLSILENLCKFEEARLSIAETDGCIGSIVETLETGSCEDQEHAVGILLSLCAQREHYCNLVLHEGVVPLLCHVSVNGNDKGKISASELLRLLRDIRYEDEEVRPRSFGDASDSCPVNLEQKSSSRMYGSIGKKIKRFFRKG